MEIIIIIHNKDLYLYIYIINNHNTVLINCFFKKIK